MLTRNAFLGEILKIKSLEFGTFQTNARFETFPGLKTFQKKSLSATTDRTK